MRGQKPGVLEYLEAPVFPARKKPWGQYMTNLMSIFMKWLISLLSTIPWKTSGGFILPGVYWRPIMPHSSSGFFIEPLSNPM